MRVIGLMTGTSIDAIDVAVVDLAKNGDVVTASPVGFAAYPLPDDLVTETRAVLPPGTSDVAAWCRLDFGWGETLAEVAVRANQELAEGDAELVVSHGQTIFHDVTNEKVAGTLQIGKGALIAEETGLPVVNDLRSRDVVAGGQGAPLTALFDQLLLTGLGSEHPVAMANLGGIANVTVVTPGHGTLAFDTGPANTLSDLVMRRDLGEARDEDGSRAEAGVVNRELLGRLLSDPYLRRPPPKSTGVEHYNAEFLDGALRDLEVEVDDLLATLSVMVATTLIDGVTPYGVRQMWVSGGGVHNQAIWSCLVDRAGEKGMSVEPSDVLGVDVDGKEALMFAVLGWFTWRGWPANVADASGAIGPRILGSITPGRKPLSLHPPSRAPTRLVMDS